MKECIFICDECKNLFWEKRFYMDCYPCCSKECFDVWIQKQIESGIKELAETRDKSTNLICFICKKEFEFSRRHLYGYWFCSHECSLKNAQMARSRAMSQENQSQAKTPSLKDFIGKECSISTLEVCGESWESGEIINTKTYESYVYMGSDDTCHIIQRKEDGEPDGIFFFPKAAVALRF